MRIKQGRAVRGGWVFSSFSCSPVATVPDGGPCAIFTFYSYGFLIGLSKRLLKRWTGMPPETTFVLLWLRTTPPFVM